MKMSGGPASFQIKLILLALALLIAVGTLIYTQTLVNQLQNREKQIVELYASSLEYVADPNSNSGDYTFALDIIRQIDFPLILTDSNDDPIFTDSSGVRNIEIDSSFSTAERHEFIRQSVSQLSEVNKPIPVIYADSVVLTKIYYGESDLIKKLRYYPYLQILFAIVFIVVSYVSFSYLKKTEQSNIWVGMAKETAHQLGTPISSLMGWQEILKMNFSKPDKVTDVAEEMNDDLKRLNKIAQRFSKIGSKPELNNVKLYELISQVIEYFRRRLPQSSKSLQLKIEGDKNIEAKINSELFEWVIENLTKNAIDAIENNQNGEIKYSVTETNDSIIVEVTDNGKGIDLKHRKDIFRPGYSTKRRGWGLGLSLAKRIVEDYHKGKIFVKNSVINHGTVFQISLPKNS